MAASSAPLLPGHGACILFGVHSLTTRCRGKLWCRYARGDAVGANFPQAPLLVGAVVAALPGHGACVRLKFINISLSNSLDPTKVQVGSKVKSEGIRLGQCCAFASCYASSLHASSIQSWY